MAQPRELVRTHSARGSLHGGVVSTWLWSHAGEGALRVGEKHAMVPHIDPNALGHPADLAVNTANVRWWILEIRSRLGVY